MKRLIMVFTLLALAAGCTEARYYEKVSEEAVKEAKDIEAAALEDAPCLIGLGAWGRMNDLRKRKATFLLCVSDADQFGVTLASP